MPDTTCGRICVSSSTAVISLRVKVPVLSEQITLVQPSVSTDASRLTIAFRVAIFDTPSASVTTVTAGSPSGIAATASATAVTMTSAKECPRATPITKTAVTISPASFARLCARPSSCFCSGVRSLSMLRSSPASRPISVPIPVAVMTISARPRVTVVFMNARHRRSPRATPSRSIGAVCLVAGRLSPVSAASSISRLFANNNRPSAGTRSPASKTTMSPGTKSAAATVSISPLRLTRARITSIFVNASRARSARFSWTKPITALSTTTVNTTSGVFNSPDTANAITAAPIRIRINKLPNWAANRLHDAVRGASANSFGPTLRSRFSTSAVVRPFSASESSASTTSVAAIRCGSQMVSMAERESGSM